MANEELDGCRYTYRHYRFGTFVTLAQNLAEGRKWRDKWIKACEMHYNRVETTHFAAV